MIPALTLYATAIISFILGFLVSACLVAGRDKPDPDI